MNERTLMMAAGAAAGVAGLVLLLRPRSAQAAQPATSALAAAVIGGAAALPGRAPAPAVEVPPAQPVQVGAPPAPPGIPQELMAAAGSPISSSYVPTIIGDRWYTVTPDGSAVVALGTVKGSTADPTLNRPATITRR